MSAGEGRWSDLAARLGSAAVLVVAGLAAVWAGGHVFHVFIALAAAAMIWELSRMLAPEARAMAWQLGGLCGIAVLASAYLPGEVVAPVLLAPAAVVMGVQRRHRWVFGGFTALVMLTGYEMMTVRDSFGFAWMLWLVLIVVASDVAGYFAGKALGGPKFWPRVSPKKTWSGTLAGWIGGGLVGLAFVWALGAPASLVLFSVIAAFAAQMGDIAESAIKRLAGVKDSSALIPGHGGFLDRFDGMIGASVFVLFVGPLVGLPPGAG